MIKRYFKDDFIRKLYSYFMKSEEHDQLMRGFTEREKHMVLKIYQEH